ncbi:hypothetical protein PUMCH_005128 [Australozyma saopauloensis]|uniref:RGS domain-containing protein n=1 Tax=Australozyma saopauloensis TaxID=291208 RepID=A0AAX4HGV4_9ASCO|nr:hypothetical protein PUMCH_005128 [[Candida] saopauloensis]
MQHSHSADCTITETTEICCCDSNTYPLSPCSSSETLLTLASITPQQQNRSFSNVTAASEPILLPDSPSEPYVTVWQPNLVDKQVVTVSEVERFVHSKMGREVDVTIIHFLVYLFAAAEEQDRGYINQWKLLHAGKQYHLQRISDVCRRTALLRDVAAQYSTFQLFHSAELRCPPLSRLVEDLLQEATDYNAKSYDDVCVTYADAIVKMFKKSKHRQERPKAIKNTFRRVFKIKPHGIAV